MRKDYVYYSIMFCIKPCTTHFSKRTYKSNAFTNQISLNNDLIFSFNLQCITTYKVKLPYVKNRGEIRPWIQIKNLREYISLQDELSSFSD